MLFSEKPAKRVSAQSTLSNIRLYFIFNTARGMIEGFAMKNWFIFQTFTSDGSNSEGLILSPSVIELTMKSRVLEVLPELNTIEKG